jgi:hypothetical protein
VPIPPEARRPQEITDGAQPLVSESAPEIAAESALAGEATSADIADSATTAERPAINETAAESPPNAEAGVPVIEEFTAPASDFEPTPGPRDAVEEEPALAAASEGSIAELSEEEVEVVVESIMATSEHDASGPEGPLAEGSSPGATATPSADDIFLDNIVLPSTASTVGALPTETELFSAPLAPLPAPDFGEDERTVISPLPPEVEPAPARGAAAPEKPRRITPTWPGTQTVQAQRQPIGRLPRPPAHNWFTTVRTVANHRVNASVAQLAIVVVSATAFGAAAVRVLAPGAPAATVGLESTTVPERPAPLHFESLPPRPPEIAPLPPPMAEVPEGQPTVEPEKPRPRPSRTRRLARAAPAVVAGEAVADKPAAEATAADPAAQPAAPAKKAAPKGRTRHVAQQGGTWVDPFGD